MSENPDRCGECMHWRTFDNRHRFLGTCEHKEHRRVVDRYDLCKDFRRDAGEIEK